MKNTLKLAGIAAVITLASCTQTKPEETTQTPAPAAETHTTIIHESAPEPVIVTEPAKTPEKSTEITINKDGGKIETKNGTTQTKIDMSNGNKEIIIKK